MIKFVITFFVAAFFMFNVSSVFAAETAKVANNNGVSVIAVGDFNGSFEQADTDKSAKPEKLWKRKGAVVGLYILALFIPWLAVGLYTGWGIEVLYNVLWSFLFGLPGIIHAFIVLSR